MLSLGIQVLLENLLGEPLTSQVREGRDWRNKIFIEYKKKIIYILSIQQ